MDEAVAQRRLVAIVAIDVAGYSVRAQADEAAAAAGIAALAGRVREACADHNGRVFNTAGDGFMLEFPTASDALDAAQDLAAAPEPPIRVGIHLGEVRVTPSGDLLGHGVNVAARIQALAPPGGVLVSAEARRAARGPLAARLVPRGTVRLEKMDETVQVFALGKASAPPALARGRLGRRTMLTLPAVAAAVVVAAVAVGVLGWIQFAHPFARAPAEPRVAVLPFQTLQADPEVQMTADGLAEEIAGVLTNARMLAVSADQTGSLRGPGRDAAVRALGADFILDGSVAKQGDALQIRVRLDDTRDHVTLWQETFSGPAANPPAVEAQAAAKATDITGIALDARRTGGRMLDAAAMADYINGCAQLGFGGLEARQKAVDALTRVAARAPRFSGGHSTLAVAASLASRVVAGDQAELLRRQARSEAALALALDPHNAEPFLALQNLAPKHDWAGREKAQLQGLAADPAQPYLNNNRSYFLAAVGRTQEALAAARSGLAANALHPGANYKYAMTLAQDGQVGLALAVIESTVRQWPAPWTDLARIALVSTYGAPEDARDLILRSQAAPLPGEEGPLKGWLAFLQAKATGDRAAGAEAARAFVAAATPGQFNPEDVVPALASIGQFDAAFSLVADDKSFDGVAATEALFAPAAAPLRRDPRFWPLLERFGLPAYWQASGHWPDLCAQARSLQACRERLAAG